MGVEVLASGSLADGTNVRLIAHAHPKDPAETAQEALDKIIKFETALSQGLEAGDLVEVKKAGEDGVYIIPKKQLNGYLKMGYIIYP